MIIKIYMTDVVCLKKGQKSFLAGVIAVSAASVLFGFLPIWCKQVLNNGTDSQTLVLIRYGFATVILGVLLPLFKISFSITKKQLVAFMMFGIFSGGVTSYFLSLSYTYMYAGIATMLHFSYPVFVALIMSAFFRERLSIKIIAAVLIAALGMVLMADIKGNFSPVGTAFAILSGLMLAVYIIATKKSAFSTLPPMKIVFYSCLVSTVFLAVKQVIGGNIHPPATKADWIRMVMIALLCTVVAHSLLAYGIHKLGATTGAIISMTEPLISVIAGAIIINEVPSLQAVAGCALVFAALIIVVLNGSKKPEQKTEK